MLFFFKWFETILGLKTSENELKAKNTYLTEEPVGLIRFSLHYF